MILRWQQGRNTVDDLLARGRLTRAPKHPTAQVDDAQEALPAAARVIDAAAKLLAQMTAY